MFFQVLLYTKIDDDLGEYNVKRCQIKLLVINLHHIVSIQITNGACTGNGKFVSILVSMPLDISKIMNMNKWKIY